MRQVEWHEFKEGQIAVVFRNGEAISGVNYSRNDGDGRSLSPVHTVTSVVCADQASNENGVIYISFGDNEMFVDEQTVKDTTSILEFYACEQDEVGRDVYELRAQIKGQVEVPASDEKHFISKTTTKTEKLNFEKHSAIREISCSPGFTCAIGNELNGRIVGQIILSEDRTSLDLFDPDGDIIVTIRPLEYTAFYNKPNQEGQP